MAQTQTPFLSLDARGSLGNITARRAKAKTTLAKRHGPKYTQSPAQATHAALVAQAQLYAHNIPPYTWWDRNPFTDAAQNIFRFPSEKHFWISLVSAQRNLNPVLFVGRDNSSGWTLIWYVGYTDWVPYAPTQKFIVHQRNTGDDLWIPSDPINVGGGWGTWEYNPSLTSTSIDWYVTLENGKPCSGLFRNQVNNPNPPPPPPPEPE